MQDFQQRQTQRDFGDGLALAFELAVTPALFGLIGYGLDRVFGLVPVLTIALALFALIGVVVKLYYAYDGAMKAHEANGPWARAALGAGDGAPRKAQP